MLNILLILQIVAFALIIWLFLSPGRKTYKLYNYILIKHPKNTGSKIEIGDVFMGFLEGDYVEAEYCGGNPLLQTSYKLFKIIK